MLATLHKPGEVKTIRAGALEFLGHHAIEGLACTVIGPNHLYGYNRFVLVVLHDAEHTEVLVNPSDLL